VVSARPMDEELVGRERRMDLFLNSPKDGDAGSRIKVTEAAMST